MALALLLSSRAAAQSKLQDDASGATSAAAETSAYCGYVMAVGASESAALMMPWVFGSAGTHQVPNVFGPDDTIGPTHFEARLRVQGGLGFSPTALMQGVSIRDRARAECHRYAAALQLQVALEQPQQPGRDALVAKIAVLEGGLPEAEKTLAEMRARLERGDSTLPELHTLELRVDTLRASVAAARVELARLPSSAKATKPLAQLEADRVEAEREILAAERSLRRKRAWDLSLRGGVDYVLGIEHETAFFGSLTFTLNTGWFFQGGSEERAEREQRRFLQAQNHRARKPVAASLRTTRAELVQAEHRLVQVKALEDELHRSQTALSQIQSSDIRSYVARLWFDLLSARSERVYLETLVAGLKLALTDDRT